MSEQRAVLTPTVVVVGGGPAGLTAATTLRRLGADSVLVLERESAAGGIPRHSDHMGYGLRDLRRVMSGPAYAELLVAAARDWRVEVRTASTVTDWAGEHSLMVTSPEGRLRVDAAAVVLATGARERPRPARMVPGDRPSGVLTTGMLQTLVHGHHQRAGGLVGVRAVVVGAELVSWSAVLTLRKAGCTTVMMTSEHDRPESYPAFTVPGRALLRVPVSRRTVVTRVIGRGRVEAVEVLRTDTGQRTTVSCDTVVFTGDWIPDNELARVRGLDIDAGSLGPVVDTALRTSAEGVFGAGNLLHPVDTADVAALDGRHVAAQVMAFLAGDRRPLAAVRLIPGEGMSWVSPGLIRPGDPAPARDRLLLWPTSQKPVARILVSQDGQAMSRRTLPWSVSPGRVLRVPWSMLARVRPSGGDVTVGLG